MSASVFMFLAFVSSPNRSDLGRSSRSRLNRFASTAVVSKPLIPVRLPPGRRRLVARPSRTGSLLVLKTIGIRFRCGLGSECRRLPARGDDHGDPLPYQILSQCWQLIVLIFRPPVGDGHVPALDKAVMIEALAKGRYRLFQTGRVS